MQLSFELAFGWRAPSFVVNAANARDRSRRHRRDWLHFGNHLTSACDEYAAMLRKKALKSGQGPKNFGRRHRAHSVLCDCSPLKALCIIEQ
jgi:hypothetical protein